MGIPSHAAAVATKNGAPNVVKEMVYGIAVGIFGKSSLLLLCRPFLLCLVVLFTVPLICSSCRFFYYHLAWRQSESENDGGVSASSKRQYHETM